MYTLTHSRAYPAQPGFFLVQERALVTHGEISRTYTATRPDQLVSNTIFAAASTAKMKMAWTTSCCADSEPFRKRSPKARTTERAAPSPAATPVTAKPPSKRFLVAGSTVAYRQHSSNAPGVSMSEIKSIGFHLASLQNTTVVHTEQNTTRQLSP